MNKIEKLLRKIQKNDRLMIEEALKRLFIRNLKGLDCQRLKGYQFIYRIRVGNFRIIYFDDGHEIILKSIKLRNESTYKLP